VERNGAAIGPKVWLSEAKIGIRIILSHLNRRNWVDNKGFSYYITFHSCNTVDDKMAYFIVSVVTPYRKISHKHKGHKNTITSYSGWISLLYIYPKGIEELLLYTKKTYNNPTIYITENGTAP
jgi:beta-glucosidase/6-phospho-beta-glucosidase/beta-galactosidase